MKIPQLWLSNGSQDKSPAAAVCWLIATAVTFLGFRLPGSGLIKNQDHSKKKGNP